MSFIRIKKISKGEYAYLVENKWTSKGSRQSSKKYLGKSITPDAKQDHSYTLPENATFTQLIRILLEKELIRHGFKKSENLLKLGRITADLRTGTFKEGSRPIVLKLNDGYLCEHTFTKLCKFKPANERFEMNLANTIVEAGIRMPPELFISVYEVIKKKINKET